MTVQLEWEDIQGNVLRGYGFPHAEHLVLRVTDPRAARWWLGQLVPQVTSAAPWPVRPTTTLNVAFTHRGLAALGLGPATLASFPADYREGMRTRAGSQLGEVGGEGPDSWEPAGVHHPEAHVLVMVNATTAEPGEARAFLLASDATDHGLELVATERLGALPTRTGADGRSQPVEHFGFADGISQPAVEGAREPTIVPGNGTPLARGRWRPVRAGEFVLGYPDEEEDRPPLPEPDVLVRNGSYLVYRKLAQDVAAFRRLVADLGPRHGVDPDLLAAKVVGRHADGTPLVPPARGATGRAALNDVRYAGDPRGRACPVGSHIRRANPRDGLGSKPELVSRHRLLRRGMPYGPPLPAEATVDDGVPRGLLFLAYCADISRQFEFLQRAWMNDGDALGAGYTQDPVTGHGPASRRFVCQVDGVPMFLAGLPRLVRVRGGEYLFQPSLSGLRYLAGLRAR